MFEGLRMFYHEHFSDAEDVRRGATLLDHVNPGWYRKIDTERLFMASEKTCILGQLYGGGFNYGKRMVFSCLRDGGDTVRYGFALNGRDYWLHEIEIRMHPIEDRMDEFYRWESQIARELVRAR